MSCVGAETGRRRQNRKRLSSSSQCGGRFGQLPGGPQPRVIATGDEAEILKELAKIMNTVHVLLVAVDVWVQSLVLTCDCERRRRSPKS